MDSRSINRAKVDVNKYSSNTKSNEIKTGKSDLLTKKVIIIKTDNKNNVIKNENNSEIVNFNKNERNHFIYISKPEYHKEILKPKIEDKVISLRNRLEYKDNCQYKEIKEFKRIETNSKINKKEYNTSYQIKTHSFRNNDKSGITLKDEEKTKTIINSNNNQEVRSQERGNKKAEKEKSSSFSTRTIASASNEGSRQIPISNISNTHIYIQNISNESDKNKKSHYQIQNESKFIINKGNKRDIFEDNN